MPEATQAPIPFNPAKVAACDAARAPKLKRPGSGKWRRLCPLHRGDGDNLVVDPNTGHWLCHSQCRRGRDIFDLAEALHGVDFPVRKAGIFRLLGRRKPTKPAKPSRGRLARKGSLSPRRRERLPAVHGGPVP